MRLLGKCERSEWKVRNKETDRLVEIGDPACQMAVDIGWATEGIDRKKMESPVPRAHGYPPAICRKTDIMDDARSSASPEIVEPGEGLQGEYSSDLSVVGDRKEGTAVGRKGEMGDGLGVRSGEMGEAEGSGVVEQGRQVKNRDMIGRWRETSGDALGNQGVVGRLKQRSRFKRGRGICKEAARKRKHRICQGKRRQTLERLATQHMQSTRRRLTFSLVSTRISLYSSNLQRQQTAHSSPAYIQHQKTGIAAPPHSQRSAYTPPATTAAAPQSTSC